MNIRRGLFRLWVVASLLWIVAWGMLLWPGVAREWEPEPEWVKDTILLLPMRCEAVRGNATDYFEGEPHEPWNKQRNPNKACWYEEPRVRELFPEYADLNQDELYARLYIELGWTQQTPVDLLSNTKRAAVVMFGPPIALIILAGALYWVFSGFRLKAEA